MPFTEMCLAHLNQPLWIREVQGAALINIHGEQRINCLAQNDRFVPCQLGIRSGNLSVTGLMLWTHGYHTQVLSVRKNSMLHCKLLFLLKPNSAHWARHVISMWKYGSYLVETLFNEISTFDSPTQKDSQKFVEFPMCYHCFQPSKSTTKFRWKNCQIFGLVVI